MKKLLTLIALIFALTSCYKANPDLTPRIVSVSEQSVGKDKFKIMAINTDSATVMVVDSAIPDIDDPKICLCVEAAFTGERLDTFKTENVAGKYVTSGKPRDGYRCAANTGLLCATGSDITIAPLAKSEPLRQRAVDAGGSLFEQMLLVHNGKYAYTGSPIDLDEKHIYRAACICRGGKFAVVQGVTHMTLKTFIDGLMAMHVRDALYLDMGMGWNYGWYREKAGDTAELLFRVRSIYQTNWLVVRAK